MQKNNLCNNLIALPKVFFLGFQMQVGTCLRTRDTNVKLKTSTVTHTLKLDAIIQSRP